MKNNTTIKIELDSNLIAKCGLYCGACKSFLNSKCQGCEKNDKASWCKVRQCCLQNKYKSCAECTITNYKECSKLNRVC